MKKWYGMVLILCLMLIIACSGPSANVDYDAAQKQADTVASVTTTVVAPTADTATDIPAEDANLGFEDTKDIDSGLDEIDKI